MTREDVGAAKQAALASDNCQVLPFVYLDIKDDALYAWGGPEEYSWGGNTFIGIGNLGTISNIVTDLKGGISSLDVTLNGIDPEMLRDAKSTAFKGRKASVWLGIFDSNWNLIKDPGDTEGRPALYVSGEMSAMSLSDVGGVGSISVTIESRSALIQQNRPAYRTDEDHQRREVGDKFFSFMPKVRNKTVYWGLQASSNAGRVSTSGDSFNPRGEFN